MSKTPEAIEKAQVKRFLDSIHAYHYWPVPSGYGRQGVDCYACIRGKFFGIEVKAPGAAPTARQNQTLTEINTSGGFAFAGTAEMVIRIIADVLRAEEQSTGL